MKQVKILCTILLCLIFSIKAQDIKEKQKIDDSFNELDKSELTLRFFNALTGSPINEAEVIIADTIICKTDFDGRSVFPAPEIDGKLKVKFSHPKYVTCEFEIDIMAGTLFFNRFSVSPVLPIGSLRVVLDWSDNPLDLDAHLIKKGNYHISFRNMKVADDGSAKLDRDATQGFGPETITAKSVDPNSEYTFLVHNFTNRNSIESQKLSLSKATVKVFGSENKLLGVYQIPQNMTGTYWEVFRIINGQIVLVNEMRNKE